MYFKLLGRIKSKYIIPYINDSQNIFFFGVFFLIISFELCQIYSAGAISLFFYFLSTTLFVMLSIRSIKARKLLVHFGYYILMICLEFFLSFAIISNFYSIRNPTVWMHATIVVIINIFLTLLQCIQLVCDYKTHRKRCVINREFIGVFIMACIVSFIFCVECINAWCRWDGYNYYNSTYNLTVDNIFQNGRNGLAVCGHISTAFALYSMIIHWVTGLELLNAMHFSNILLMIMDITIFYYIIKKLIPKKKTLFYILSALLCGFSPYVMGIIYDISPELLLMSGIFLLIYGNLYNQYTLCLIAVFIMCNTKETGVVVAAMMVAASFVKSIIGYYKEKKSINYGYYLCILTLGILWLIHYSQLDWAATNRENKIIYLLLDGTPTRDFHFSLLHIRDIFKGEFLTNFTWLFLIVLCLAVLKTIVLLVCYGGRFWRTIVSCLWNYWEIIAGFVGFQIISCLFVTYQAYRYYISFASFIYLIGVSLIEYLVRNIKYRERIGDFILCSIALLFFVQSYYTIDFLMINEFNVFSTGNGKVAVLDQHIGDYYDPSFTTAALYNRQIMYFDKALDKSLSLINPDNNTEVLFSDEFAARADLGSRNAIQGYEYERSKPARWVKFDKNRGRRYLEETEKNELRLNFISENTKVFSEYQMEKERVFYIEMPWENLASNYLKVNYGDKFKLYGTVKYRGWVLNIYQFTV